MIDIAALYREMATTIVTSHRGFSGLYPENTVTAFEQAVAIGTNIIEFDLRSTADCIPAILHDASIDRTSNGSGRLIDYTLQELRDFDFSGDKQSRTAIPSFEEALIAIPDSIGLNIQIKETEARFLENVCALHTAHGLTGRAYFTVSTFADAKKIQAIDPSIDLCILERKRTLDEELLRQMADFGCRFAQPHHRDLTPELCDAILKVGLFANVFFSNTDETNRRFIEYGIRGIMTDRPDILIGTIGRGPGM